MHMTFLQLHSNNIPALQKFYTSLGFLVTDHDTFIDIPIGSTLLRFRKTTRPSQGVSFCNQCGGR